MLLHVCLENKTNGIHSITPPVQTVKTTLIETGRDCSAESILILKLPYPWSNASPLAGIHTAAEYPVPLGEHHLPVAES
jgi:hypothetical protein